MTKQEVLIEAEWARALYEALTRYEPAPIYEQVCADLGRPVLVGR